MKVTREELMGASIHLLEENLSARALNILAAAEIRTVEQLITYEPRKLQKFRNCGRKTINELRSFLAAYQLDLSSPSDDTIIRGLKAKLSALEGKVNRQTAEIAGLKAELFQWKTRGAPPGLHGDSRPTKPR
jgi:hypothetical protein